MSIFGSIKVQFAYYHCRACGRGYQPWRGILSLQDDSLTAGCRELVSLAGILGSFGEASDRVLQKMSGLQLSESTIERTAEAVGARVTAQLEAGRTLGPTAQWAWQKDARGLGCAYVSVDATGVRQQGPGGTHVDGKMAYVAMVYNARSEHDSTRPLPRQVRYLSGFYDFQTLGPQLHGEALEVGWTTARQQIAISDRGNGLEDFFRRCFPKAECILDFWHAKEHLVELAQILYPKDEQARQRWTDDACHRLKHQGGPSVRHWLETLETSSVSAELSEAYRTTIRYFRNHEHRMDYPRYVRKGWQIGSGPVESACKTVVGNRLKGGGMRWGPAGSDAVCHLRGLYLREPACWDTFWYPSMNSHPQN